MILNFEIQQDNAVQTVRTNSAEVIVKELAINAISSIYGKPIRTAINERSCIVIKPYAQCRPDLIIVIENDVIIVEVKTYKDTIKEEQFINYTKLGNYLYFAFCGVGSAVSKLIDTIPEHVGIIEVDTARHRFIILKKATRHKACPKTMLLNLYHFTTKSLISYGRIPPNLVQRIYKLHLYYFARFFDKSIYNKGDWYSHKESLRKFKIYNTKFFKRFRKRLDKDGLLC